MNAIVLHGSVTQQDPQHSAAEGLPPLVPDLDADPFDGIPQELLEMVGTYDRDTAGGCG